MSTMPRSFEQVVPQEQRELAAELGMHRVVLYAGRRLMDGSTPMSEHRLRALHAVCDRVTLLHQRESHDEDEGYWCRTESDCRTHWSYGRTVARALRRAYTHAVEVWHLDA